MWADTVTAPISTVFLRDVHHGGSTDQLTTVANDLAAFVSTATTSIDIAIYDFRLSDPSAVSTVVGALTDAADRGVSVRVGYDAGKPTNATAEDFAVLQADPAPPGTAQWVQQHFNGTQVQTKPIRAGGHLMHCKYIIRDAPATSSSAATGAAPGSAAVWTGSTNFTDDAWTRQENNIIIITSASMAAAYRTDFDQMWSTGTISGAGQDDTGSTQLAGGTLGWDFCPGDGTAINTAIAARINAATERIIVAAMVLTSHEVLAAMSTAIDRGMPVAGIYDGGQMDPIVKQWTTNSADNTVLANWEKVSARLADKQSTPYTPTGTHDFMHLKVLITDDTITTGSYNFSANAEHNAENQIHLTDPNTVAAYTDYLTAVTAAYPAASN